MPFEVSYDKESGCLIVKAKGTIDCNDIIASRDLMVAHPNFRKGICKIIDCSKSVINVDMDDMAIISHHFTNPPDLLGEQRKIAIVALSDVTIGRARQMDIIHGSKPGLEVASFRSLGEAAEWISQEIKNR